MSENDLPAENTAAIEESLKGLLDKMLDYFQKFIKTDNDLQELEEKLNDYDNLTTLVKIISEVFSSLTEKMDKLVSREDNENYDELEKIVQKYEAEIRTHIQVEQQLKLYAESLQSKVDDSEKNRTDLLDQTKNMINDVKRDNQKLAESCKRLKDENKELLQKVKELETSKHDLGVKLAQNSHQLDKTNTFLEKLTRSSENSFYNGEPGGQSKTIDTRTINLDAGDPNKVNIKSTLPRKILKTSYNARQQSSPLRISNRNSSLADTRNSDYIKVKPDITDNEQARDIEALKRSYQQFYRRRSSNSRERTSVSKTRELKSMYSQSNVAQNSSNTSLVYISKGNMAKPAPKDTSAVSLHKKSRSSCASPKTKASLTKKEFEKFLLYSNSRMVDSTAELNKSKYKH